MPERDPQFEQDVLRIVYAALADREALAAAMSGQQPLPVASASAPQPDPAAATPGAPSPTDVGIQGGAGIPIPPSCPIRRCAELAHLDFEDLGFDVDTETRLHYIEGQTGATREQILQEALRRVLADQIEVIEGLV